MDLPLAPVEKILKRTKMRVSDDAVKEFAILLEEVISDVAAEATAVAKSKGRRTVTIEDVLQAERKIK